MEAPSCHVPRPTGANMEHHQHRSSSPRWYITLKWRSKVLCTYVEMLRRLLARSGIPSALKLNSRRVISTVARRYLYQPPSFRQFHPFALGASFREIGSAAPKTAQDGEPFEEESLPDYDSEQFYPIRIGDTIHDRYRVIGKLGYGANSTVWFCRDLLLVNRHLSIWWNTNSNIGMAIPWY